MEVQCMFTTGNGNEIVTTLNVILSIIYLTFNITILVLIIKIFNNNKIIIKYLKSNSNNAIDKSQNIEVKDKVK